MSKTAMSRARLEPELKENAETILHRLGMNATQAITMFYKQIELRDGLPFDVVIPTPSTKRTVDATDAVRNLSFCENSQDMCDKLGVCCSCQFTRSSLRKI